MNPKELYGIFKDENLKEEFAQNGFIRMPFLNAEQVLQLHKIYNVVSQKVSLSGFATTTTSPDFELKRKMFEEIRPIYSDKVNELFQDYKLLGTSFLKKDSGDSGFLPLHQDWTVTDEAQFRTITIWIPLVDTRAENGAMQVIPGSHLWTNLLRGPNLPIAISNISEALRDKLVLQEMKAGEALIFDHSLFHASTLNLSDSPRIAITYGICHKETPLSFWYWHQGEAKDRFEKIAVPDDFFLRYPEIGTRPNLGRSLGFYRQDLAPLELNDFIHDSASRPILREYGPDEANVKLSESRILLNKDHNKLLAENGFVLFPLMDEGTVSYLKQFFLDSLTEEVQRFYASVHHPDADYRTQMNVEIRRTLRVLLGRVLDQGELLGSSFIAKPKGNSGILPPHADWNIVDERYSRSYNLWIPLVDTTIENGAIHIIPGSHNWMDDFRGPGIPNPYAELKNEIWAEMQAIEMKAGTALLYDHRLLHASPANQTEVLRIACVSGIKDRSAAMRYYHSEGQTIRAYASNPDFYLRQNPEVGPGELPLIEEVANKFPIVTKEDLLRFLGRVEPESIPSLEIEPKEKRSFFETYSIGNIMKEIAWRLGKRK